MALELNGTTGVSLVQDGVVTAADLASGAITSAALPTGSVLQVVQGTTTTRTDTTSQSYVTTALTASITPSSTSNKVLCIWTGSAGSDSSGDGRRPAFAVFLNSVETSQTMTGRVVSNYSLPMPSIYLHSPNSTSAQTFTIYMKSINGNNVAFLQEIPTTASIILMEIAG